MGRIAAAAATLVLVGTAASAAHAQSAGGSSNLSGLVVRVDQKPGSRVDDNRWGPQDPAKTFQLSSRKWGLKLDLEQPVGRERMTRDVEAGAFYRITPSLRVGGAVRLDEKAEDVRRFTPKDQAPRVRLETAFQF